MTGEFLRRVERCGCPLQVLAEVVAPVQVVSAGEIAADSGQHLGPSWSIPSTAAGRSSGAQRGLDSGRCRRGSGCGLPRSACRPAGRSPALAAPAGRCAGATIADSKLKSRTDPWPWKDDTPTPCPPSRKGPKRHRRYRPPGGLAKGPRAASTASSAQRRAPSTRQLPLAHSELPHAWPARQRDPVVLGGGDPQP